MLERLYSWYGKKVVLTVLIAIIGLFIVGIYLYATKTITPEETVTAKAEVKTQKVRDIGATNSFSSVGTVQAVSEARLQTEAGGRVTSVNTEIGKSVRAGAVLATIENASESASLLQAQGAYEAAVAGARSSQVGVGGAQTALTSAQVSGINTYQDANIVIDGILHTSFEEFFTMSGDIARGFKLNGGGLTQQMNRERTALEAVFDAWLLNKNSVSEANISTTLETAYMDTLRLSEFIEALTIIAQDQDTSTLFKQEAKDAMIARLFAVRVSVNTILKQIEGAKSAISSAKKGLEQAQIAGSSNTPSASSAQIKIALGSLRSAQANYEKTLVRTPISGVVNALYLKTGEYVSPSTQAAIVANNNGLEIVTGVGEDDREKIIIGAEVVIDGTTKGIVTAIAGAVDPTTGKVAVKVSVSDDSQLKNGSTATIAFTQEEKAEFAEITIPLSALKMTGAGPVAFEVSAQNTLVPITLELGAIAGDSVVVKKGLTANSMIVVDARGLKEGQEVTVK
jgi:multidrug efflux pump subunit AcrA (membrane-fusion protein)